MSSREKPTMPTRQREQTRAPDALGRLLAITDATDVEAALGRVEAWKRSHEVANVERSEADRTERNALVAKLVVAGWETPATAWADPVVATDATKRSVAEPFASMPIAALRERVARLSAVPRALAPAGEILRTGGESLTTREIELCKRKGLDPKKYAETRAAIRVRSAKEGEMP